jgi:hypothetical protein
MTHAYITTEQDIPNIVGQGRYFALQFSDGYASSVIITGVRELQCKISSLANNIYIGMHHVYPVLLIIILFCCEIGMHHVYPVLLIIMCWHEIISGCSGITAWDNVGMFWKKGMKLFSNVQETHHESKTGYTWCMPISQQNRIMISKTGYTWCMPISQQNRIMISKTGYTWCMPISQQNRISQILEKDMRLSHNVLEKPGLRVRDFYLYMNTGLSEHCLKVFWLCDSLYFNQFICFCISILFQYCHW